MAGPWEDFIDQLFADANADEAKAMAEMLGDRPRTKARAREVVTDGMAAARAQPRRAPDRPARTGPGAAATSKARLTQGGKPSTFDAAETLGGTGKFPLVVEGRCVSASCAQATKFDNAKAQDLGGLARFVLGISNPAMWLRIATGTGCRYYTCGTCGCLQKVCMTCLEVCKTADEQCHACGHVLAL